MASQTETPANQVTQGTEHLQQIAEGCFRLDRSSCDSPLCRHLLPVLRSHRPCCVGLPKEEEATTRFEESVMRDLQIF